MSGLGGALKLSLLGYRIGEIHWRHVMATSHEQGKMAIGMIAIRMAITCVQNAATVRIRPRRTVNWRNYHAGDIRRIAGMKGQAKVRRMAALTAAAPLPEKIPNCLAERVWVCRVCGTEKHSFTEMFNHLREHGVDISKLNMTNTRIYLPRRSHVVAERRRGC